MFPAISRYPMWGSRQLPGRVADTIGREGINLPSGVRLTRAQVARVAAAVRAAVAAGGNQVIRAA